MHKLPENLRYLRQEKGLSQAALAKHLGYKSAVTIAQWETGVRTPELENIILLAKFFNVSIDYLVGFEN